MEIQKLVKKSTLSTKMLFLIPKTINDVSIVFIELFRTIISSYKLGPPMILIPYNAHNNNYQPIESQST